MTMKDTSLPIVMSEWNCLSDNKVKRVDYTLGNLTPYKASEDYDLFSSINETEFDPICLKSFELIDFKEVQNAI